MRGIPLFNFPAFDAVTKRLRELGYEVFSPAERDRQDGQDGTQPAESLSHYMAIDLPEVCKADAIALLPGWEDSVGCKIELTVANALGKPVFDAWTLAPVTHTYEILRVQKYNI